jgi:hypothetical protein
MSCFCVSFVCLVVAVEHLLLASLRVRARIDSSPRWNIARDLTKTEYFFHLEFVVVLGARTGRLLFEPDTPARPGVNVAYSFCWSPRLLFVSLMELFVTHNSTAE